MTVAEDLITLLITEEKALPTSGNYFLLLKSDQTVGVLNNFLFNDRLACCLVQSTSGLYRYRPQGGVLGI